MKMEDPERGFILVLSLLMLLFVSLIAIAALGTTTYHSTISGNKRVSEQAFYRSEAAINEFVGRFRPGAGSAITDAAPSNPNWRLYLALDSTRAQGIGYVTSSPNHHFVQSLQNTLDFALEVRHKVTIANSVITKHGAPVYIVTSRGYTQEGGNRVVEIELTKSPSLDPPAPLYSEQPVNIHGSSTYIQGIDACGANDKPGIVTTLSKTPTDPISISGSPTIQGSPDPKVYGAPNLNLRETLDYLKKTPDYSYTYTGNQTVSGASWGTPVGSGTTSALTYSGSMSIVYFNMNGTNTLKLTGGTTGAGILLVDGSLEMNGGFKWYGLIIVTGSVDYTGGGEKNVTGAVLCGENATVQVDVGGNAGIIYCSAISNSLKNKVSPYNIIRWREIF
jgi:hypothetical protein